MVLNPENGWEVDMDAGDIEEFVIAVMNDGEADLIWDSEIEIIREADDEERDAGQRNVREGGRETAGQARTAI